MEELIEKIGWKKFAVIIVVLCFVLLSFAILSFMNIDKKQTDVIKKKIEEQKTQTNIDNNKTKTFTNSEFRSYSTDDYQLTYPPYLTAQNASPSTGAKSKVQFVNDTKDKSISIEVFAKPQNTYDRLSKPYLLNNYEPEAKSLKFENSVEFIPLKVTDPLIHEKIDFMEKKDVIIKATLKYSENGLDTQLERDFAKLLGSIK